MKSNLLVILILILITSCQEQVPVLTELNETNINDSSSFNISASAINISGPDDEIILTGTCDARFKDINISLDNGSSWKSFTSTFSNADSFFNCKNNQFKIKMPKAGDFYTFTSTPEGRKKQLQLRGDLGFTKSHILKINIASGDFTPPSAPDITTLSQYDSPTIYITGGSESDFSHFECKVGTGVWYSCNSGEVITNNGTSLSNGHEDEISVTALDSNGNRSDVSKTRFKNGNLGQGVNGIVNAIHVFDNGDMLIGGAFEYYEPEYLPSLIRLNSSMDIDPNFKVGTGFNYDPDSLLGLKNGGVLVTGSMSTYKGATLASMTTPRTYKLTATGDIDTSIAFTGEPKVELSQSGDFIIIKNNKASRLRTSDNFLSYAITPYNSHSIEKIRADEVGNSLYILTRNSSTPYNTCLKRYNLTTGDFINDIICEPSGYVLENYPSDTYEASNSPVKDFELLDNQNIVIAGSFNYDTNTSTSFPSCTLEYNPDGTRVGNFLSRTITPYTSSGSAIRTAHCVKSITKIGNDLFLTTSENFLQYNDSTNTYTDRSYNNPTLEIRYSSPPLIGFLEGNIIITSFSYSSIYKISSNEKTLLPPYAPRITTDNTGHYITYTKKFFPNLTKKSSKLILLDKKGNLKKSFNNIDGTVREIHKSESDKIYILGSFSNFEGSGKAKLVRLNSDLSLDPLTPNFGGNLEKMKVDKLGNIYLFTNSGSNLSFSKNGITSYTMYPNIIKLDKNFNVDSNFRPIFKMEYDEDDSYSTRIYDIVIDDSDSNSNNWFVYTLGSFTGVKEYSQSSFHETKTVAKLKASSGEPVTPFSGVGTYNYYTHDLFINISLTSSKDLVIAKFRNVFNYFEFTGLSATTLFTLNKDSGAPVHTYLASGSSSDNGCKSLTKINEFFYCIISYKLTKFQIDDSGITQLAQESISSVSRTVNNISLNDGKIILGGDFESVQNQSRSNLAALDENLNLIDDLFSNKR